jgi:uncharacterized OB-fold protein
LTTGTDRPLPVADARSAEYWSAAARHVLALPRCADCGYLAFPPDVVCPHCRSANPQFAFEPVTGDGSIRSWAVVHDSFLPGFDADLPFVLVDVELDEQSDLRMIGRLLDGPSVALQVGDRVSVAFEDLDDTVSIPAFALHQTPDPAARP